MRIEIVGGLKADSTTYSELESKLEDVLGPEGFSLEGSGQGVFGMDMGFTGKGPLTTKLVREMEKEIRSEGLKIGSPPEEVAILVFSK